MKKIGPAPDILVLLLSPVLKYFLPSFTSGNISDLNVNDKEPLCFKALLEAMEQQSISVAKAGVVCSLPARYRNLESRCSVTARCSAHVVCSLPAR